VWHVARPSRSVHPARFELTLLDSQRLRQLGIVSSDRLNEALGRRSCIVDDHARRERIASCENGSMNGIAFSLAQWPAVSLPRSLVRNRTNDRRDADRKCDGANHIWIDLMAISGDIGVVIAVLQDRKDAVNRTPRTKRMAPDVRPFRSRHGQIWDADAGSLTSWCRPNDAVRSAGTRGTAALGRDLPSFRPIGLLPEDRLESTLGQPSRAAFLVTSSGSLGHSQRKAARLSLEPG